MKNQSPVAICKDVTMSADNDCQVNVSIDNGSFDPDPGDAITIIQTPPGPYDIGVTSVILTITDDQGVADSCTANVEVLDTTPPGILCPKDIIAECSGYKGTQVDLILPDVYDNCDANPVTINNAPPVFQLGGTQVSWETLDKSGNSSSCIQYVRVNDTIPPDITLISASPDILWPPSHKMIPVNVNCESIDFCDESVMCRIIEVTNNQSDDVLTDGDSWIDWGEITDYMTVALRAERRGKNKDRIYTITVECTDDSGNSTKAIVKATVPHNFQYFLSYKNGSYPQPVPGILWPYLILAWIILFGLGLSKLRIK